MQECLKKICREFEKIDDFLKKRTSKNEDIMNRLFYKFIECFSNLREEKLEYPNEFITDVKLYNQDFKSIIKKFEDIEIRYLMLSDFYDYSRITKKYLPKR